MSNKNKNLNRLSRFISLILRHKPEVINIDIDESGYVNVNELIIGINKSGRFIDINMLEEIVKYDNKNRYSFSSDKTKIRANQGHSICVDVGLNEGSPKKYLYHGTAESNLESILQDGIKKMNRLYIHLSNDIDTALKVGHRHGVPIVLRIDTEKMKQDGYKFYLSSNKIWLTEYVPKIYIEKV